VLDRTMALVATGRAKLQGTNLTAGIPVDDDNGDGVYGEAVDADGYGDVGGDDYDDGVYGDEGGTASYDHLPPPPGGGAGNR